MRAIHLVAAGLVVGCVTGLAACSTEPSGVLLPPGSESLPLCEPGPLHVDDLATIGIPGCNLQGSALIFPDGSTVTIEEPGWSYAVEPHAERSDVVFTVVNWGVPGIGAAHINAGVIQRVWATSTDALTLQREALRQDGYR